MPLIPYPHVPNYPGVPQIPRNGPQPNAIAIPIAQKITVPSQAPVWAIYNSTTYEHLYSPKNGAELSFLSYGFTRAMNICDFPIEAVSSDLGSGFSSYNKVYQPANPIVTLAMSGPESEQAAFLMALDNACSSTDLYTIQVPDTANASTPRTYTVESYSYRRSSDRGATLLMVEISFRQILQTTATLSNVSAAQSASSASPVSSGTVQPSTLTDTYVNNLINQLRGNTVGVPN